MSFVFLGMVGAVGMVALVGMIFFMIIIGLCIAFLLVNIYMHSFTKLYAFMFQGCCLCPSFIKVRGNWKKYQEHQHTNDNNSTELTKLRDG